ncbi:unnamed protein product [Rhizoctonia solani]|uniref:Protein kinase domain-containing protein n=1 Tax=Rhizoctonia solani TaxID=456999 RepID=A0A8H2X646_9AGAM|nr:unnamed protein product [Rhizoctonia solani]
MELPPHPHKNEESETLLIELECLVLIDSALGLWYFAEIRNADNLLAMMRVLARIDEILKHACHLGTTSLADIKNQIRVLAPKYTQLVHDLRYPFQTASWIGVSLIDGQDAKIPGLGRKAIPDSLKSLGVVTVYICAGSHGMSTAGGLLSAYRDQFSVQAGILNSPFLSGNFGRALDLKTFFQTLEVECPIDVPPCHHFLVGTNPRVHLIMRLEHNFELYSIIKHPRDQDLIFKDRRGKLHSSNAIWNSHVFPGRLEWTIYRLGMDQTKEPDTLGLVLVESPLTQISEIQSAPADHFQSLFAIWKHIVELEKQSEGNLIGWVIEIDELSVDSPEMSYYLESVREQGLVAFSRQLGCELYSIDMILTPLSHSVLGKIYRDEPRGTASRQMLLPDKVHCVKGLKSDHYLTRLLRAWCRYDHPNVLSLIGIQEMPHSGIGLVFSETSTKSLSEYLAKIPNVDRCKSCIQISSGLAYLHGAGVVHGKLRAETGEPVISDPLLLEADPSNNAHARLGWLAPEVIKGEPLTQASDVYSLGMTILEVLGGVPTDLEGNYAEALNVELIYDLESVLPKRPEKYIPTNSRDGDDLWKLLSRCCSVNPVGRPITDWVAEIMQMITQDGLQERYTLQESGNDPCFEPRGNAFKKESLELSDVESVSSSSSDTNFRHSALNGLAIHDPSVADQGLLGTESRIMARKILKQLATHGCENLTDHMNQDSFSVLPLFRGGFGDVYRGNLLGGLKVAVKTPQVSLNILEENPNYLKDVAREIHTWSKCDHPNVLHFLGLAEFRGQIGMVAPWMESGSLPRYLKKAFGADRCKLCTQICEGVAYLHEIGIVHGDLKGENVLISADGVAVISDFGGSLLRNRSLNIIPLEKGSCLTYRWAAPELLLQGEMDEIDESSSTTGTRVSQNSAKCPLNTRESDIYALGMTILVSHH